MNKRYHRQCVALLLMLSCLLTAGMAETACARDFDLAKYDKNRWSEIKKYYLNKSTNRLIFVKYKSGSKAKVVMLKKVSTKQKDGTTKKSWKKIVNCSAYVGENGLYKERAGDRKTPVGTFNITMGFGRKKSPGTAGISYKKLKWYHYWSSEHATYNRFIDVRKLGRKSMSGEHLITYNPEYNYALAMDFNKKCKPGAGSGIFMHCMGDHHYTAGCVAVSQKNMKKVVQNTTKRTKICIYRK